MGKVQSWEVSDAFWERVKALIPDTANRGPKRHYQRRPGGGRKPMDVRTVFEGIVFVLRTGCHWKALPKERFGSASSIHKYFRLWLKEGFFLSLWEAGLAEFDEMEGIAWKWQSIDGCMIKAPLARQEVGATQLTGGINGSKRHLLVEGHGVPLSILVTGANRHDVTQLAAVLDAKVAKPQGRRRQYLCADKGYHGHPAQEAIVARRYIPKVRRPGIAQFRDM